jgi:integrase
VWTKPSASTKQRKVHRLPLSPEGVELLREVRATEPFQPFVRLTDWQLRVAWREILAEAKLGDLHVHDLRHWHASLLASMGLSLPIIGALLGHSSPATTGRYAHLLDEALRQAAHRVGEVVRLPRQEES